MKILEVKNLHVNVGDKEILKGIDLDIFEGKVHVLMERENLHLLMLLWLILIMKLQMATYFLRVKT